MLTESGVPNGLRGKSFPSWIKSANVNVSKAKRLTDGVNVPRRHAHHFRLSIEDRVGDAVGLEQAAGWNPPVLTLRLSASARSESSGFARAGLSNSEKALPKRDNMVPDVDAFDVVLVIGAGGVGMRSLAALFESAGSPWLPS